MPQPISEAKGSARTVDAALIGTLSALIFICALFAGHWANALIGAAGFYFFGDRLLAVFLASKLGGGEDGDDEKGPIDPGLAEALARLESARVVMAAEIARRMRTRFPVGLAGGVGLWCWLQFRHDPPGLLPLGAFSLMGAGIGWAWAAAALAERYRQMYKVEVLPRLAAGFGPLCYRAAQDIDLEPLRRHRLFGAFDHSRVEDEIIGDYRDVPVSIVELRLEKDQDKSRVEVFDGLLVRITLPRSLHGTTTILADEGAFGALRDLLCQQGERVRLEDPDFERRYQVFGTDQIAARALLTPAFMQRFLALGERTGFRAPLAFAEDAMLTIALPKCDDTDLFEPPSYAQPAASRAALARLHADIAAVLAVAEAVLDLDQSVRVRAGNTGSISGG